MLICLTDDIEFLKKVGAGLIKNIPQLNATPVIFHKLNSASC